MGAPGNRERPERRQGVGGGTLAPGGRAGLVDPRLDRPLREAVAAWMSRPSVGALFGVRHGVDVVPDLAGTARAALRRGGMVSWPVKEPRRRRRPGVLVLWDVSGSMGEFVPHFFPWLHGLVQARENVRVVAFARDFVEVTGALLNPAGEARAALQHVEGIFGGGTAIASTVRACRLLGLVRPSTVVVMISDGWEAEAPAALAHELAALVGEARRLVWVNPLMATPGYEPVQRGIETALRYADIMEAGLPYASLTRLGRVAG